MFSKARSWRVLAGGVAAGIAGVVGFAGTTAAAEPTLPSPPAPAPVTVTQTVTVAPAATAAQAPQTPSSAVATAATPALTTTLVTPEPTLVPASSGTLRDFLQEKGVRLEPQNPRDFRALHITLPMPAGWTQVPDPNVPDAFAVIADRAGGDGLYTNNAQVVVYKLVGDFDPKEAITHGFIDSQQLPNWQSTDASLADLGSFPSSLIEGTYRQDEMALNTSRRHVIASAGGDKFLVTLSVTTPVSEVVAAADATDAIANGFRVSDPAAPVTSTAAQPLTGLPTASTPAPVTAAAQPLAGPATVSAPVS